MIGGLLYVISYYISYGLSDLILLAVFVIIIIVAPTIFIYKLFDSWVIVAVNQINRRKMTIRITYKRKEALALAQKYNNEPKYQKIGKIRYNYYARHFLSFW